MPVTNKEVDPYALTNWTDESTFDFRCPSGQLCLLRNIDVPDLLSDGLLQQLDSLTSIVSEGMPKKPLAKNSKAAAVREAEENGKILDAMKSRSPEEMKTLFSMVNRVVTLAVVKPVVAPVPDGERVSGVVYVDTVNFADRMAIFGKVMEGTSNLQQFRESSGESARSLEDVSDVPLSSE